MVLKSMATSFHFIIQKICHRSQGFRCGDFRLRHLLDVIECQFMIPIVGSEAGEGGEGGFVGLDVVGEHVAVDLEPAGGGVGGEGAEVEEGVVVAEGEGDGVGTGGLEEAERLREVLVAGAEADLVPEHVLRRLPPGLLAGPRVGVRVRVLRGGGGGGGHGAMFGFGFGFGRRVFKVMPERGVGSERERERGSSMVVVEMAVEEG